MGTLDKFLDEYAGHLDVSSLLSPEVIELDSASPPSSVFKYFSEHRSEFFFGPALRYTQRTNLNDPFELSTRWKEFISASTAKFIAGYVKGMIKDFTSNKGRVLQAMKEEAAKTGVFVSPDQMAEAARFLLSEQGRIQFAEHLDSVLANTEQSLKTALYFVNLTAEEQFNKFARGIGILSLTETSTNRAMWSLYASEGRGFVIEFDSDHPFFKAPNGRTLLKKVQYSNEWGGDFIENPYRLFWTKHEEFSFEREWRMILDLAKCDSVETRSGVEIFTRRLTTRSIKSVIFGYNYDARSLAQHGARLRIFDEQIQVRAAIANTRSGEIELHTLI